jgi:hypothetical protein
MLGQLWQIKFTSSNPVEQLQLGVADRLAPQLKQLVASEQVEHLDEQDVQTPLLSKV